MRLLRYCEQNQETVIQNQPKGLEVAGCSLVITSLPPNRMVVVQITVSYITSSWGGQDIDSLKEISPRLTHVKRRDDVMTLINMVVG